MNNNEKFDVVEFYKRISAILEDYREQNMSYNNAVRSISELNDLAKSRGIDVNFDASTLEEIAEFDDERSYVEEYSYESSYDD